LVITCVRLSPAQDTAPSGPTSATAAELLEVADRALGATIQAARASSDANLAETTSDAKPFWLAVKALNESLDKARRGLALKDNTFFPALHDARAAAEAMQVAFRNSGAEDDAVRTSMGKMYQAAVLVSENYGLPASLAREDRPLNAGERELLQDLQAKQSHLNDRIAELETKQGADREEIQRLRKESKKIRDARYTSGDLAGAIIASHIISGVLWGGHWWWGDWWWGWGPTFFVGWIDLSYSCVDVIAYDWTIAGMATGLAGYELGVAIADEELEAAEAYIGEASIEVAEAEAEAMMADELVEEGASLAIEEDAVQEALDREAAEDAMQQAMEQATMQEAESTLQDAFETQMIDAGSLLDDW
jgi:hypothetical protein